MFNVVGFHPAVGEFLELPDTRVKRMYCPALPSARVKFPPSRPAGPSASLINNFVREPRKRAGNNHCINGVMPMIPAILCITSAHGSFVVSLCLRTQQIPLFVGVVSQLGVQDFIQTP